jgi:hypothetical protein
MTDPMGDVFLSYRHSHQDLAAALDQSLREHGIPIWRDVRDVGPDPLQGQIIEDLDDPELAGGIVLVTEDVVDSEIILEVELLGLYDRWQADDEFFVVVVLAPDVGYDDAERIIAESPSPYDFSQWYMESLKSNADTDGPPALDAVVTAVLERRLEAIHNTLGDEEPIECSLDTYDPPAYPEPLGLTIDWSHHFDETLLAASVWNGRLHPALTTVIDQLQQTVPGRSLRFRGSTHLPAAFATGNALQTPRGIDAAWMQSDGTGGLTRWTNTQGADESDLHASLERRDVTGSDLAVFASISDDVASEVGQTKSSLPNFNGILELAFDAEQPPELIPSQAAHAATVFRQELRDALNEFSNTSTVHLFMAGPALRSYSVSRQTRYPRFKPMFWIRRTDPESIDPLSDYRNSWPHEGALHLCEHQIVK